jgi:hypothetical protein
LWKFSRCTSGRNVCDIAGIFFSDCTFERIQGNIQINMSNFMFSNIHALVTDSSATLICLWQLKLSGRNVVSSFIIHLMTLLVAQTV